MKKLNVSQEVLKAVKTYNQSIHGELVQLGSAQAADCLACHASSALHDIFKKENPHSSINSDNLAHTCRQCHQSTNRWFIRIAVHPGMHQEANRVVAGTSMAFRFILYGAVFGMLGLLLLETIGRRKDGIKLLLKNGTTWRRNANHSRTDDSKYAKQINRPESAGLSQPWFSYAIGSIFIMLSLVVLAGIIYHLTISSHGPGLLKPFWEKYVAPPKSEIMDEARRREEMEKHRHFHIIAPEYPRWPEKLRPVCFICHSDFPHSKNKRTRSLMNLHTQFLVCETCHIKEKPGAVVVYRWYDPLEKNPKGPFYGTSYDPKTESLSRGKNLMARIAPFRKMNNTGKFQPEILQQDAPLARDYMKVRDKLSPEERGVIKNKFHENVKPKGHDCKECHSENSILDFKQLGFADNRASNLKTAECRGVCCRNTKNFTYRSFFPNRQFVRNNKMNQDQFTRAASQPNMAFLRAVSAAVVAEFGCFANHPVTGDDIRYRIMADSRANRPGCFGKPDLHRDIFIGDHRAEGNSGQRLPDLNLKIGPFKNQMQRFLLFRRGGIEYL